MDASPHTFRLLLFFCNLRLFVRATNFRHISINGFDVQVSNDGINTEGLTVASSCCRLLGDAWEEFVPESNLEIEMAIDQLERAGVETVVWMNPAQVVLDKYFNVFKTYFCANGEEVSNDLLFGVNEQSLSEGHRQFQMNNIEECLVLMKTWNSLLSRSGKHMVAESDCSRQRSFMCRASNPQTTTRAVDATTDLSTTPEVTSQEDLSIRYTTFETTQSVSPVQISESTTTHQTGARSSAYDATMEITSNSEDITTLRVLTSPMTNSHDTSTDTWSVSSDTHTPYTTKEMTPDSDHNTSQSVTNSDITTQTGTTSTNEYISSEKTASDTIVTNSNDGIVTTNIDDVTTSHSVTKSELSTRSDVPNTSPGVTFDDSTPSKGSTNASNDSISSTTVENASTSDATTNPVINSDLETTDFSLNTMIATSTKSDDSTPATYFDVGTVPSDSTTDVDFHPHTQSLTYQSTTRFLTTSFLFTTFLSTHEFHETTDIGDLTTSTATLQHTHSTPRSQDKGTTYATVVPVPVRVCACACSNVTKSINTTIGEKEEEIIKTKIIETLAIDMETLSSQIRKKASADDPRTSSRLAGILGMCLVSIVLCFIFVMDFGTAANHLYSKWIKK